VIGTRPEAIKIAPVAHALASGIEPSLIFTGQHPLDAAALRLGEFAAIHLCCPGGADPERHAEDVRDSILPLLRPAPHLLIVQGDTSSALGAARAAKDAGVPLAHIEAGLRTFDRSAPWPEEGNRVEIDRIADLLFAPTQTSADNLRRERIRGAVHVTGNTSIDALQHLQLHLPAPGLRDSSVKQLLVTCHRRESWGEGLERIAAAVAMLAAEADVRVDVLLHPNPHVSARMAKLLALEPVTLLKPCSQFELLLKMQEADLVLTDSGGIQEEAPALGIPLLVLRDKTERPEGIAGGAARLVGTDPSRIVEEALRLIRDPVERARMSRPSFPYGDGQAAPRIASIVREWLAGSAQASARRSA